MSLTYEQAAELIDLLVEHFDSTCDTYEQAMVYAADGLRYNLGKFSADQLIRYAQGSGCPAAVAMLEESDDEEAVNG